MRSRISTDTPFEEMSNIVCPQSRNCCNVNENVTDAKTLDFLLLFPVPKIFVGEVVTLSQIVSVATRTPIFNVLHSILVDELL